MSATYKRAAPGDRPSEEFTNPANPDTVRHLFVFADKGAAGHLAAEKAEIAHAKGGRHIEIRFPILNLKDWNDVAQAMAKGEAA